MSTDHLVTIALAPCTDGMHADQDDCLIAIEDGRPVPVRALSRLPPWRAVLVARVAERAGVPLELGSLGQLVSEQDRLHAPAARAHSAGGGNATPPERNPHTG